MANRISDEVLDSITPDGDFKIDAVDLYQIVRELRILRSQASNCAEEKLRKAQADKPTSQYADGLGQWAAEKEQKS